MSITIDLFEGEGRVTVEYCGAGSVALVMLAEDERERAERRAARELRRRAVLETITGLNEVGREVNELCVKIDESFHKVMRYCGFYQHKRQWRSRRAAMDFLSKEFKEGRRAKGARQAVRRGG